MGFDRVKEKSDNDYALSDSIARLDSPQAVKDIKMLKLQNEVLEAMADYRYFLEHNYRNVHEAWNERELPHDSIPGRLSDKDMSEVASEDKFFRCLFTFLDKEYKKHVGIVVFVILLY